MSLPSLYPPRGGWLYWAVKACAYAVAAFSVVYAFGGATTKASYGMALAVWLRVIAEFDYYEER